uniref:RNA-directed DNA polymerase, eukaryota, reverse transcriptase zinc-binding domain protein n=1 Tax=Tanacetum cinerariifolium TaxID=118510 RepID=A0A6L2N0X9_TANCI|nr:hypothetical protein [Tanacetum cinerariifolium]
MPLDNKPPDPTLEEFFALIRMSYKAPSHKPFIPSGDAIPPKSRGRLRGVKNQIKSVKVKLVYCEGICNSDNASSSIGKKSSHCSIDGNDGTFINKPLEPIMMNVDNNKMKEDKGSSNKSKVGGVRSDVAMNIESFVEKMKKGVEDRKLLIKFNPQSISTQSNGNKRISISLEDIKKGSVDYALQLYRVLVEVSATNELSLVLEIEYPVIGDRPSRIGKLEVKYEWKPPQCLHCKTFGNSTSVCKVRPKSEEEIAAGIIKDVLNINKCMSGKESSEKMDIDGFIEVEKKNKHAGDSRVIIDSMVAVSNGWKVKRSDKSIRLQKSNGNEKSMSDVVSSKKSSIKQHDVKSGIVRKPSLISKYNADFQPKVLVRGSRSSMQVDVKGENVLVKNYFQALEDHDMVDKEELFLKSADEEFKYVIWPKLHNEVEEVMKSAYVDDKDVEFEKDGMSMEMKSGIDSVCVPNGVNIGTDSKDKLNCKRKSFLEFVLRFWEDGTGFLMPLLAMVEAGRRSLWMDLSLHNLVVKEAPWALLDFRSCITKIEISDLAISGLQFTWNKCPNSPNGLLKKLDRVMCNMGFLDKFPNANAVFLPFVCSDHSPSVLNIPNVSGPKPQPFRFTNFLSVKSKFLPIAKSVWERNVLDFAMLSLASKLKMLKKPLRKLKFDNKDLAKKAEEVKVLNAFNAAVKDEDLFLKQRSKITWLKDMDGNGFSGDEVREQFVKHFQNVLGRRDMVEPIHEPSSLFLNKLSLMDTDLMKKIKESDEIKFHWKCEKFSITHLCFTDDLLIFSHGDVKSVSVVKSALEEFRRMSGLKPSMEKSLIFFGNVSEPVKVSIL